MTAKVQDVTVNGRTYGWPAQPVVVVCIDGSEPAYIEEAVAAGRMPFVKTMLQHGADLRADCVVPSFTNPNNLSIVTGVPPLVHGISANYFLDRTTGQEVMMNHPRFLWVDTILNAFADAGARVACVTAKDKLRALLGRGLDMTGGRAVNFSAEQPGTTAEQNGIGDPAMLIGMAVPDVYSTELSEFVLGAGVWLLQRFKPHLCYLSTTDYTQHQHAPGTPPANDFYAMMDGYFSQMAHAGALLVLTADHGMNAKHDAHGAAYVIYLQTLLDGWLGAGVARVVLPITDPYVVHHGALGSFATVYLQDNAVLADVLARLRALEGIAAVYAGPQGCAVFELPPERMGDVLVVSARNRVLGTRPERHDLSLLRQPLRSHGGISEQRVPLVLSRPLREGATQRRLRNFDAFDLALNHLA